MAWLGGGAIFWSEALLDALTDERVMRLDWNRMAQQGGRALVAGRFFRFPNETP